MKKIFSFLTLSLCLIFTAMNVNAQNVSVNPGGGSYPTLKDAFDAINAGTHTGVITVGISSNTTETGPCVLNASGAGSASYTSITINPVNDGIVVSGPTTTGRGLIELNGADNVTINGDNPNTGGINRNLSIQNTAANTVTYTSCIRTATSTLITSVDNNSVVNCYLVGSGVGRNVSANTTEIVTWGIIVSGGASTVANTTAPSPLASATTTMASGQTAANMLLSNNYIVTVSRGISINGAATTVAPNLVISNNLIGNSVAGDPNQVTQNGITVSGCDNCSITANTVYAESFHTTNSATRGIEVGVISANTTAANITNNIIGRVRNNNTSTYGAYGINLNGGNNHSVINNAVLNCTNDQTTGTGAFSTTFGVHGIRIGSGTGHKVYHNSVNLSGVIPGGISTDLVSCFTITSTALTGCDVRNNIFSNTLTGGNSTLYNDVFVCVYLPSGGTSAMNLTLNNNAYYQGSLLYSGIAQVSATGNATNLYLAANFAPGVITPSTNLRAYTSTLSAAGTNDNASFATTNAAPFTSATNLHIPFATPGPLESGGAFTGVTIDVDGQVRPGPAGSVNGGATAPDIGYDEFDGVPGGDITPPVITYTALTNTSSTSNRSFTNVTVTDLSGVNGTAGTRPRVYYKRSGDANTYVNNTSGSNGWKYAEASGATSPFSFTIDYTLLNGGGGVTVNDVVQYFVVAQDLAAVPNVGINSGIFNANPSSVALTSGAFPLTGTINSYIISGPPLAGDYTVGVALFNSITGNNITFRKEVTRVLKEVTVLENNDNAENKSTEVKESLSLTDGEKVMKEVEEVAFVPYQNGEKYNGSLYAGREEYPNLPLDAGVGVFATITDAVTALNVSGSSAAVRFLLLDATYASETLPITIDYATASAVNTLTIQPNSGVSSTVTGAVASNAVFKILSSYVTIQGSNNGTVTRDLTITNTSTTTPSVIHIASTGVTPITNVSLLNCNVINGINSSSAVVVSDVTLGTAGYFNNITIQNNRIQRAYVGIYNIAVVSAGNGTGLNVRANDMSTSGADAIRYLGVYVQGVDGGNVSSNIMANFDGASSEDDKGIWFATGTTNSTANGNYIHDLIYTGTGGYGGQGIAVSTTVTGANITISNNMIANLSGDGWSYTSIPTDNPIGISIYGSIGQSGINVYYNSINMYGNTLNKTSAMSMGIYLAAASIADIRDNSIVNSLGLLAAIGYGTVGVYAVTDNTQFANSNYNNYYVNATGSGLNYVGQIAASGSANLAAWQGATGQDANSLSADPLYVSGIDLHINSGSPLINAGTPIAGITTDIDGQTRSGSTPTIGADEPAATQTLSLKMNFEACPNVSPVTVEIRSSSSPYNLVQSVSSNAGGNVFNNVVFTSAVNGVGYYLVVKSANMVETWSAAPVTFTAGSASYNFTTALSQAYGSNQKLSGGIVSVYQGDANQDGFVNSTDILAVYNNAISFINSPTTDFNCDGITDVTDIILATNNSSSFVQVQKP
ncbi:MAG TPA: hypothetical protein PKC58_14205 [Ignavibacteria bacterium]|nr:hypothetical protein [Ignavibacteria bacterium]